MSGHAFLPGAVLLAAALASDPALAAGDTYLIVSGKGAGSVIVTDAPGSTTVAKGDNPVTSAEGEIGKGVKNGGVVTVYHGTLGGKANPHPFGVGWGEVVKVPAGASITGDFAAMVQKIGSAAFIVANLQLNCSGQTALDDLDAAKAALDALKAKIDTAIAQGAIPAGIGAEHKKAADELKKALDEAKKLVAELIANPPANLAELVDKVSSMKNKGKKMAKKLQALLEHLRDCKLLVGG